jgi:hypothetical protein
VEVTRKSSTKRKKLLSPNSLGKGLQAPSFSVLSGWHPRMGCGEGLHWKRRGRPNRRESEFGRISCDFPFSCNLLVVPGLVKKQNRKNLLL